MKNFDKEVKSLLNDSLVMFDSVDFLEAQVQKTIEEIDNTRNKKTLKLLEDRLKKLITKSEHELKCVDDLEGKLEEIKSCLRKEK